MRITKINDNIYHLNGDTLYELSSTFIRMEEFYESPFDSIRGQYFTMDQYMDLYAEHNDDTFSYFEDWYGFNIPGNSLIEFFNTFSNDDLRMKERNVRNLIENYILENNPNFYIIGSVANDALYHEYAHANYYLNSIYRKNCDDIYTQIYPLMKVYMHDKLLKRGYTISKLEDEIHAYCSTATISEMMNIFEFDEDNLPITIMRAYQDNFETILPITQVDLTLP